MAETLAKDPAPMNYHSALNVVRDIVKANPDAMLVNEGANALDFTRSIVDMYKPRKRLDVGTWGVMGIGMGFSVAAAVVSGEQVIAIEGDSAFGFSGMECETICRYDLPVCVVILNNNGVYRGDEVNPTGGAIPRPLVFVKGARYEKLMEAFGGVGVLATTPAELRNAMEEAIRSRKPTLINAVIDEKAGTESGRITSLNPSGEEETVTDISGRSSAFGTTASDRGTNGQGTGRRQDSDFTHVQSGPTCTQLLAWMGADVIKVERAGEGDITRGQLRDIPGVDSLYFTMLNHNKRSITVDAKNPKGKAILESLVKHCDVLVENFAPGALDRMGPPGSTSSRSTRG